AARKQRELRVQAALAEPGRREHPGARAARINWATGGLEAERSSALPVRAKRNRSRRSTARAITTNGSLYMIQPRTPVCVVAAPVFLEQLPFGPEAALNPA